MSDAALPFRESFCFNTLTIERVYMCSCCFLEHVWIGFLYGSSNFLSSFHLLSNIASYLSTVLRNTRSYLSLEHDKNAKRDNYALASMLWFYEAWVLWKLNHIRARARNISGTGTLHGTSNFVFFMTFAVPQKYPNMYQAILNTDEAKLIWFPFFMLSKIVE